MKRVITITTIAVAVVIALVIFKQSPSSSVLIWNLTRGGTWLLPLVTFAALLDSIHPCSFSILLITIAFLFSMQLSRKKILQIGAVYIAGIFASYLLIGLSILRVLHLFNTPHFMGKLGAGLLIVFGLVNILNYLFPNFPFKLRLPAAAHAPMSRLIDKASIPAAFALGGLVGICQFPCLGGPYLMVIGLLRDQVTYLVGLGYLVFYNLLLVIPLFVVLMIASDKALVEKIQKKQEQERSLTKIGGGIVMVVFGILIYFLI